MEECADWSAGLPSGRLSERIPERIPERIVVVLDATDGLSRAQRDDMWSRLRGVAETAPAGSVLHLFEVQPEASGGFREVAALPRPPHPCEVNHWSDNPDQRAAQWGPLYLRPLRDALSEMSRSGPSDSSAIFQAVQAAARRFDEDPAAGRRLILISDLMQNVGIDFYRGVPEFPRFRESALYREVRTRRLAGAELTVLRLPPSREGLVDEEALIRFWSAWFADQETSGVEAAFIPIEGARPES